MQLEKEGKVKHLTERENFELIIKINKGLTKKTNNEKQRTY